MYKYVLTLLLFYSSISFSDSFEGIGWSMEFDGTPIEATATEGTVIVSKDSLGRSLSKVSTGDFSAQYRSILSQMKTKNFRYRIDPAVGQDKLSSLLDGSLMNSQLANTLKNESSILLVNPLSIDMLLNKRYQAGLISDEDFFNQLSSVRIHKEIYPDKPVFDPRNTARSLEVDPKSWLGDRVNAASDGLADLEDSVTDAIEDVGDTLTDLLGNICHVRKAFDYTKNINNDKLLNNKFKKERQEGATDESSLTLGMESKLVGDVRVKFVAYFNPLDYTSYLACNPVAISDASIEVDAHLEMDYKSLDLSINYSDSLLKDEKNILNEVTVEWPAEGTVAYYLFRASLLLDISAYYELAYRVGYHLKTSQNMVNSEYEGSSKVKIKFRMKCEGVDPECHTTIDESNIDESAYTNLGINSEELKYDTNIWVNESGKEHNYETQQAIDVGFTLKAGVKQAVGVKLTILSYFSVIAKLGIYSQLNHDFWSYSGNTCGDSNFDGINEHLENMLYGIYGEYGYFTTVDGKMDVDLGNRINTALETIPHLPEVPLKKELFSDKTPYEKDLIFFKVLAGNNKIFEPDVKLVQNINEGYVIDYQSEKTEKYELEGEYKYRLSVGQRPCFPFPIKRDIVVTWSDGLIQNSSAGTIERDIEPNTSLSFTVEIDDEYSQWYGDYSVSIDSNGLPSINKNFGWLIPILHNLK